MNQTMTTLALLAVLTAAPGTRADAAPHDLKIEPYTFETFDGRKVEAELGRFRVPVRRTPGNDRTIELAFVRFPATTPDPGPPIVYLAGGPGGSGISTAQAGRFPVFMALRAFGDVIAFDQRGTGMSEPDMPCPRGVTLPLDRPMDRDEVRGEVEAAGRECAEAMRAQGIDLSAYTTTESADDVNALREALGAERVVLWGTSYGTHLALAVMRRHPDRVDRVILAGVEGLHHTYKLPSDSQAQLERIAALASDDPRWRERLPDMLGSIARLLQRLKREPVTVPLVDPRSGQAVDIALGPFDLQMTLAGMLRGPDSFDGMPDLIARLEQDDWMALALPVAGQRVGGGRPSAMSLAMDCASGETAAWRARIDREAEATLLGDAINWPFPEVCDGLGVPPLGDDFRAPVRSSIPTLVVSGTLDGRTPVSNGEEVLKHLKRGAHLVVEGAGHGDPLFLASPAILETMQAFLRGEKVADRRVRAEHAPFVAPRSVVALDDAILERYQGVYQVGEGDVRRVVRAGPLLFTVRGERGRPFALRAVSETDFFYEGMADRVRFETAADGTVTGMIVFRGDDEGERAKKIE